MHAVRSVMWSNPALWRIAVLLAGLLLPPVLGLVRAIRRLNNGGELPLKSAARALPHGLLHCERHNGAMANRSARSCYSDGIGASRGSRVKRLSTSRGLVRRTCRARA